MLSKKWVLIGALVLAAALALAACSPAGQTVVTVVVTQEGGGAPVVVTATPEAATQAPGKDTAVICMGQEPDTLYGLVSNMATATEVRHAFEGGVYLYDTAYFYTTNMLVNDEFPTLENGGAVLADGVLTVTFKFKDNITWSDGTPFTVDDVLFSKDVALDPNSGATTTGAISTLTYTKVDDHTLTVAYPKGAVSPTYFLLSPGGPEDGIPILPQHTLKDVKPADIITSDYARKPSPVLGPYQVTEWVEGDHISLDAVPNWWGGEVKLQHLVYRFIPDSNQIMASILSGDCDMATSDGTSITQLPFIQQSASRGLLSYAADPGTTWEHIEFNTWPVDNGQQLSTPFFADARVRQAVAYGTNRQQMTEEILYGEVHPLNSYLPDDHWAYNAELDGSYPFDPDKAKSMLKDAGWEDKNGDGILESTSALKGDYSCGRGSWSIPAGTDFKVTLFIPAVPAMRGQLATIFQSNMKDLGIDVSLNQVPSASALFADGGPLFTRKYDLAEFAWSTSPDPSNIGLYGGENVYQWDPAKQADLKEGPTGPFLVAGKILEQNPKILDGTGITADMFKFGRAMKAEDKPDASKLQYDATKLPDGVTFAYAEQTPEVKDNQEGQNDTAYCNEDVTQALYDQDNKIDPKDRLPFAQAAQKGFMADLPVLPMFQRLILVLWSPSLCNIQPGPVNYPTWNVEQWYFANAGEQCPQAGQ